jgi:protein SCO1/2
MNTTRRTPKTLVLFALLALLLATLSAAPAHADAPLPPILQNATFDQRLDQQVPLDLTFRDEQGQPVNFSKYFADKPVILTLNYYDCPTLCPLVIDGLITSLTQIPYELGKDFRVVTVSINPNETTAMAAKLKRRLIHRYGNRPGAAAGWDFLTGDKDQIDRLAQAVGFNYAYDARTEQYAHPSGLIFLTDQGKIARYIYGMEFAPRDLRLSLVETSEHKISTPVDTVLLFCYRYDPTLGSYGPLAVNSMRVGAIITILVFGSFLILMFRRERTSPPQPAIST